MFSLTKGSLEGLVALCKYIRRVNSEEGETCKPKNNVGRGTNGLKLAMNKFRVELGFSPLDEKALFGNRVTGAKLLTSVTHTWQELCELLAGTISPWYDPGVHDPVKAGVCRCLFSATNNWTLFGLIFLELAPL